MTNFTPFEFLFFAIRVLRVDGENLLNWRGFYDFFLRGGDRDGLIEEGLRNSAYVTAT